jgi:N-acetylglucosamine kinase-like BadF-type ATPase
MTIHLIGVDGGTTKTIALVADDQGCIVGAARGGNSNWTGPDVAQPMAVVGAAVRRALAAAGLAGGDVALGVFGLAGADWPEDHDRRQAVLVRAGIARRVIVKNDAFVGLRAGTRRSYGVVVAAGTSCNAAAIAPDGREWHFGYYQDYGGAITIGREAVRAVLHAEDGRGPATTLTPLVLNKLGYETPEALLRARYTGTLGKDVWCRLCPLAFEAALAGDPAATRIIVDQGLALAAYATALVRRFDMTHLEFDVVLSGSVYKGVGPLLIDTITQAVHREAPRARIVRARFEPAVGGLLLAYDTLEIPVTDEVYENLARTMPGPGFFRTTGDAGREARGTEEDGA